MSSMAGQEPGEGFQKAARREIAHSFCPHHLRGNPRASLQYDAMKPGQQQAQEERPLEHYLGDELSVAAGLLWFVPMPAALMSAWVLCISASVIAQSV